MSFPGIPRRTSPALDFGRWLPQQRIVGTWGLLLSVVTLGSGLLLSSCPSHPRHKVLSQAGYDGACWQSVHWNAEAEGSQIQGLSGLHSEKN